MKEAKDKKGYENKIEEENMKKATLILAVAVAVSLISHSGLAQFKPDTGEIKGHMIAEYYENLRHHTGSQDVGGFQGRHGFWFRRIYLTYNNTMSEFLKMRLRVEMNSPGDFLTSSVLNPFVKDAYLSFNLGSGLHLVAGIQAPPSFANEEDIWGYRAVEKTPLDLYKWTSSRDFGISLKGGRSFLYHIMFANGSSYKSETNSGKKVLGSLGYRFGGWFVEAVAQYERAKTGDDDLILKGFGAYSSDWGRVGAVVAYRDYRKEGAETSLAYNIFSVFAVIKAGKKIEFIGRFDRNFGNGYRTAFRGEKIAYVPFANNAEFGFAIAGLSYQVCRNVWLIPNVKCAIYDESDLGEKPDSDFYGNLTLWFKF